MLKNVGSGTIAGVMVSVLIALGCDDVARAPGDASAPGGEMGIGGAVANGGRNGNGGAASGGAGGVAGGSGKAGNGGSVGSGGGDTGGKGAPGGKGGTITGGAGGGGGAAAGGGVAGGAGGPAGHGGRSGAGGGGTGGAASGGAAGSSPGAGGGAAGGPATGGAAGASSGATGGFPAGGAGMGGAAMGGAAAGGAAVGGASGRFSSLSTLVPYRAKHTATMLNNGKILIAGGWGPDFAPIAPMELFDPATSSFSPAGDMSPARYSHAATLLSNGKVLMVAGNVYRGPSAATCTAMVQLYDPATGTFTPLPDLSRYQCDPPALATLADSRVLIVGIFPDKRAYLFDPATGQLTNTGVTIKNRAAGQTATRLNDGRVLIVGGVTDDPFEYTSTAEVYDPATGTFSAAANMAKARGYHTADLLPNGKVLIAGGIETTTSTGATFRPIAELFDPATNSFTPGGSLALLYDLGTSTRLQGGKILLAGGNAPPASGTPATGSQLYDPATGLFSAAANMSVGRYLHTVTLLPSGAVLIIGGDTGGGPKIVPAEIYE